jgi:tetratricopeptide (TPR) repeat protein
LSSHRGFLGPGDAGRLSQALQLLQAGRTGDALALADEVARRVPDSADALHLRALCRKASGDLAGSATDFEAARARAPHDINLLGNHANLLSQLGQLPAAINLYRLALEHAPSHGEGWMNLGITLRRAGDLQGARSALQRAVELRPASAPSWQALAGVLRSLDDLEGAEGALRRAVTADSQSGMAWLNLGVVRRLLGDPVEALDCYKRARSAGFNGPELEDAEASAYLDLGEPARALAAARQLTSNAPVYVAGHALLAHVLWEHGEGLAPGEDPLAAFRAAVASQPENHALRLEFIRFLLEAKAAEEALSQIRALRANADRLDLVVFEADALELLEQHQAAADLFASAYPRLRGDAGFLNLYVRHLLRGGYPEMAAERALEALESEPDNQLALAYLGIAWRLTGDPREDWLCGYDRLVAEVQVDPPAGFSSDAEFLHALGTTLDGLHKARREPVNQSLRGGSQTSGSLFGRREPVIAALRAAIAAAVSGYIAGLPEDPSHPFLRRRAVDFRFVGSWSVRLQSSGRHVNHFHQKGWISSAYYVALPPSMSRAPAGETAGCIQFGEPPAELRLDLGPRRVIRPRVGGLVLFPSYIWHGTVPFHDEAPRMTVAFDVQPSSAPVQA